VVLRVSYNGHYVAFPRLRRGFDSLHPHHLANIRYTVEKNYYDKPANPQIFDRLSGAHHPCSAFDHRITERYLHRRAHRQFEGATVAYRPGYGYEGYKLGSSAELYAFAVLAVVLFFVIPVLGFRLHARGKNFPLILYFFSTIILCFNFVVAKALLQ
jgi:hypothetical protein